MADIAAPSSMTMTGDRRNSLHKLMQRKSTIAFLMALPLIMLILVLVAFQTSDTSPDFLLGQLHKLCFDPLMFKLTKEMIDQ